MCKRISLWVGLWCLVAFVGGCGSEKVTVEEGVVMWRPTYAEKESRVAERALKKIYSDIFFVNESSFTRQLGRMTKSDEVLVLGGGTLPVSLWRHVEKFIDDGGSVVFYGVDPFSDRFDLENGRPRFAAARKKKLIQEAKVVPSFNDWQHWRVSAGVALTELGATSSPAPWPSVSVKQVAWREQLVALSPPLAGQEIKLLDNTLAFFAKGDAGGCRCTLTLTERDGSQWQKVVLLEQEWMPYVLHQSEFSYVSGGVGRGRKNDHCYLFRVGELQIGYDGWAGPVIPTATTFSFSDIRVVEDSTSVAELVESPRLPLVAPADSIYAFEGEDVVSLLSGRTFSTGTTLMGSPHGLSIGLGGEHGLDERWIPVFRAIDRQRKTLGYPASLYVETREGKPARRCAWIGFEPTAENAEAFGEMTKECIDRLRKGTFLYRGGSEKRVFKQRETLRVSARVSDVKVKGQALRITAQLRDEKGDELRFVKSVKFSVPQSQSTSLAVPLNLGMVPVVSNESQKLEVRLVLHDAEDPKIEFDDLRQWVKVQPPRATSVPEEFLRAQGSKFYWSNVPVHLLGLRYELPYCQHSRNVDYLRMEQDLSKFIESGFNTIWVVCKDWGEADALLYLVDEASRLGLWTVLAIPDLHPAHQDLVVAKKWVDFLRVTSNARVAAFVAELDSARSQHLPASLKGPFMEWLEIQYGSLDHAQKMLNLSGSSRDWFDQLVSGALSADVNGRFLSDMFSRSVGEAKRMLQTSGYRHLLGVEPAWVSGQQKKSMPGSWNPRYCPLHADIICGQPSVMRSTLHQVGAALFMTRLADSVSAKRPFMWKGLEPANPMQNRPYHEGHHQWLIDRELELVKSSASAGSFFSSFRTTQADLDLFNLDGSRRLAGESILKQSRALKKSAKASPRFKRWTVEEPALLYDTEALLVAWMKKNEGRENFKKYTGLSWSGNSFTTDTVPRLTFLSKPYESPAPVYYLNAEWGVLALNGQPILWPEAPVVIASKGDSISAKLWNSGLATWQASEKNRNGAVWIHVASEHTSKKSMLRVKEVEQGAFSEVALELNHIGRVELRPFVWPDLEFGESLIIDVQ